MSRVEDINPVGDRVRHCCLYSLCQHLDLNKRLKLFESCHSVQATTAEDLQQQYCCPHYCCPHYCHKQQRNGRWLHASDQYRCGWYRYRPYEFRCHANRETWSCSPSRRSDRGRTKCHNSGPANYSRTTAAALRKWRAATCAGAASALQRPSSALPGLWPPSQVPGCCCSPPRALSWVALHFA